MENKELIKIDRNGTKHWRGLVPCDRCSGLGLYAIGTMNGQPWITSVDNGICHKCNGTKKVVSNWKEYTPEYQAKLDAQRAKRAQKKCDERFANIREEFPDGIVYIVLGNTYEIKEQIKADGGKFNNAFLWHFNRKVDGYNLMEIKIEDAFIENGARRIDVKEQIIDANNKIREEEKARQNVNCEFVGNVGDKLKKIPVILERTICYSTNFGLMRIHIMRDEQNNVLVWKTSNDLHYDDGDKWHDVEEKEKFIINATIKEHAEYNGVKQTVLTRVKCAKCA